MAWLQIKFYPAAGAEEAFSELLGECGAMAVTLEDAADEPLFEPAPGATPLWRSVSVLGLFDAERGVQAVLADLKSRLPGAALPSYTMEYLQDRDWERAWMDRFEPMRFGRRLWVCPNWLEPPDPEAVNIRLDPGLAFGTGTHETTALCLEWLDAHPPVGMTCVDYGAGSGILAIAAARLGARRVWATDIDPQSLEAVRENAHHNGVEAELEICLPQALPPLEADLVMANILAGPLLTLAPELAALVRPGGNIVLSGILAAQQQAVSEAYAGWFEPLSASQRGDWVCLSGVRRMDETHSTHTRCPHCRTVFAVTGDKLRVAEGRVRCGHCFQPFNALEHEISGLPADPDPPPGDAALAPTADEVVARAPSGASPATDAAAGGQASEVPEMLAGDLEQAQHRPPSLWLRVLQVVACVLLLALLLAQYAWFMPADLARRVPGSGPLLERAQPWLRGAFAWTGVRSGPYRAPGLVRVINRDVRAHPSVPGALLVNASLVSEAPLPQPYPMVELSLFDVNGGRIARRAFTPRDYLPAGVDPKARMAPGAPIQLRMELMAPRIDAVSYEFAFQ